MPNTKRTVEGTNAANAVFAELARTRSPRVTQREQTVTLTASTYEHAFMLLGRALDRAPVDATECVRVVVNQYPGEVVVCATFE